MAYIKTVWVDDVTPISATNMNHIEQGIMEHQVVVTSDVIIGHIEIATQAETSLASSTILAVTPARLKGLTTCSVVPSDNVRSSSDAYIRALYTTFTKLKAFTIPISGTYRVKFSIITRGDDTGTGRIYKNGVAFGTSQVSSNSVSYVVFSEDLVFNAGETCELWGRGSISWADFTNFRMCFDLIRDFTFDVTTAESPVVSF